MSWGIAAREAPTKRERIANAGRCMMKDKNTRDFRYE
jgi:hypothetical protein